MEKVISKEDYNNDIKKMELLCKDELDYSEDEYINDYPPYNKNDCKLKSEVIIENENLLNFKIVSHKFINGHFSLLWTLNYMVKTPLSILDILILLKNTFI